MSGSGADEWGDAQLLAYAKARIDGCRKGGQRSAERRRESARRKPVEHVIRHHLSSGTYDRNAAGKIASYLGVSARYVRLIAGEMKKSGKVT